MTKFYCFEIIIGIIIGLILYNIILSPMIKHNNNKFNIL